MCSIFEKRISGIPVALRTQSLFALGPGKSTLFPRLLVFWHTALYQKISNGPYPSGSWKVSFWTPCGLFWNSNPVWARSFLSNVWFLRPKSPTSTPVEGQWKFLGWGGGMKNFLEPQNKIVDFGHLINFFWSLTSNTSFRASTNDRSVERISWAMW